MLPVGMKQSNSLKWLNPLIHNIMSQNDQTLKILQHFCTTLKLCLTILRHAWQG